jgi:isopentenyldiphosphate isomerase
MAEQIIDIINENNEVVDKATRTDVIKNNLLHRAVKIVVINDKEEFLLCKMPENQEITGNKYEIGIWGEVLSDETFEDAMYRKLKDSLHINPPPVFVKKFRYENEISKAIVHLYALTYEEEIKLKNARIKDAKFLSITKIEQMIDKNMLSPISEYVFINTFEEIKEISK